MRQRIPLPVCCPRCGGLLRGHGKTTESVKAVAHRYRCRDCGKTVTWRDGGFSTHRGRRYAVKPVAPLPAHKRPAVWPIHPFVLGLA